MQTTSFKAGDLVRLNSGSPILTVDDVRGDGVVVVVYWGGSEFVKETFLPAAITLWSKTDASGAANG